MDLALSKPTHLRRKVLSPIKDFLKDSRSVGILLMACTFLSILFSNLSFLQSSYVHLWQRNIVPDLSFIKLPETNRQWINDVLMTFFFFLVGMEIKRELVIGELATIKKSLLPVLAALGGMVFPALIFFLFNGNTPYKQGWGIPMATDIAFSLGVLSLLGKKVPVQLKIFLAALAIIDDLGAVVTIAIFYTSKLKIAYLLGALLMVGLVWLLNFLKVKRTILYMIPGVLLWFCIFNSGIHATIAGVLMAFSMPLNKLAKLEHLLYYPVNFIIMPLFAFANTAIIFPSSVTSVFSSTISYGVMAGLVLGKPLGIFLFSFIAVKLKIAALPSKTSYSELWGIGLLGGIGFTMSIFTTSLAYGIDSLQVISKVSIISASIISSICGFAYLYNLHTAKATPVIEMTEASEAAMENSFDDVLGRPAIA